MDDGWEAVRLAYDDVLAMDVILPERGVHLSVLDFETLNTSVSALDEAANVGVDLAMPPSFPASVNDPTAARG